MVKIGRHWFQGQRHRAPPRCRCAIARTWRGLLTFVQSAAFALEFGSIYSPLWCPYPSLMQVAENETNVWPRTHTKWFAIAYLDDPFGIFLFVARPEALESLQILRQNVGVRHEAELFLAIARHLCLQIAPNAILATDLESAGNMIHFLVWAQGAEARTFHVFAPNAHPVICLCNFDFDFDWIWFYRFIDCYSLTF